jgi:hypothetical protein
MGQISDQVSLQPSPSSEKKERELLHRQWVDKLLALLKAHRNHSITTLKLAIMVLKDLVYAEGEPAALSADQVRGREKRQKRQRERDWETERHK